MQETAFIAGALLGDAAKLTKIEQWRLFDGLQYAFGYLAIAAFSGALGRLKSAYRFLFWSTFGFFAIRALANFYSAYSTWRHGDPMGPVRVYAFTGTLNYVFVCLLASDYRRIAATLRAAEAGHEAWRMRLDRQDNDDQVAILEKCLAKDWQETTERLLEPRAGRHEPSTA